MIFSKLSSLNHIPDVKFAGIVTRGMSMMVLWPKLK